MCSGNERKSTQQEINTEKNKTDHKTYDKEKYEIEKVKRKRK